MALDLEHIRGLKAGGKLHSRLVVQVRILLAISLIMLVVVGYQVAFRDLQIFLALAIAIAGFLFGLLVFSKMNKLVWDEEKEIITTGRMEYLGFAILILYIGFDIGLRTVLKAQFPDPTSFAATAYLLAGIGASLFGRSLGTLRAIQKLSREENISLA